jgi:hypothetical protein
MGLDFKRFTWAATAERHETFLPVRGSPTRTAPHSYPPQAGAGGAAASIRFPNPLPTLWSASQKMGPIPPTLVGRPDASPLSVGRECMGCHFSPIRPTSSRSTFAPKREIGGGRGCAEREDQWVAWIGRGGTLSGLTSKGRSKCLYDRNIL